MEASDPSVGRAGVVEMVTVERDRHRATLGVKREEKSSGVQDGIQESWLKNKVETDMMKFSESNVELLDDGEGKTGQVDGNSSVSSVQQRR